jgi:hypothetical protein
MGPFASLRVTIWGLSLTRGCHSERSEESQTSAQLNHNELEVKRPGGIIPRAFVFYY